MTGESRSSAISGLERLRRLGGRLKRAFRTITSSLPLSLAVVGLGLFVGASLLRYGVWPALMAVWGAFLILFGTIWYLIVRWSRS